MMPPPWKTACVLSLIATAFAQNAPSDWAQRAARALELGDFREAERVARRAVNDHPAAANSLGVALFLQGKYEEAEAYLRQAASSDPAVFEDREADAMRASSNLAQLLAARGETARAEPVLRRTLWWFEKHRPLDLAQIALEHHNLGSLFVQEWRHEPARQHLEHASRLWRQQGLPPQHPLVLQTGLALALLDSQEGRLTDAWASLQRLGADLDRSDLPAAHPVRHAFLLNRAMVSAKMHRLDEARADLEKSLRTQWNSTAALPNETLRQSVELYRKVLEMARDRRALRRVTRWQTAMRHERRKPWECVD